LTFVSVRPTIPANVLNPVMPKRKHITPRALEGSLLPKQRKPIPHAFVLDAISTLSPYTRPMFGCIAIYVKDKIMLILRG
jgi:hypothetical protein